MMNRAEFLCGLIGKPWRANAKGPDAFDCWHLCVYVSARLFGRSMPVINVPENPSWAWLIKAFDQHPERRNWREVRRDAMGIIRTIDGAGVLMARVDRPAHAGLWLTAEKRVLHADPIAGVSFETLASLRLGGWHRLRFYEPTAISE